jgi:predicted nucleic acid-binding protein
VLRYPQFRLSQEEISRFERDVREHARLLHPQRRLQVILEDPDDDRVLECAATAHAGWIITGDPHLLVLGTYAGIRIVTAPQALEQLGLG